MEVLKKITDGGWIISEIEMKQILECAQIRREDVIGQHNYFFRGFIEEIIMQFQITYDKIVKKVSEDKKTGKKTETTETHKVLYTVCSGPPQY